MLPRFFIGQNTVHHPALKVGILALIALSTPVALAMHPVLRAFGRRGVIIREPDKRYSFVFNRDAFRRAVNTQP